MQPGTFIKLIFLLIMLGAPPCFAQEVRIKDLASVRGSRTNQLIGFGLVVGLNKSGDSAASLATNQALANMLTRLGIKSAPESVPTASVAAVVATAELPTFSRVGDRIDIKVSTIGDAKSLAGGTLLLTPLHAGDNNVYVVAQGSVVVGQASGGGTQVQTVARVPQGGSVEREFVPVLAQDGKLMLSLKESDFTTNHRLAESINTHFKGFFAKPLDPTTCEINVPPLFRARLVEFVAELEALRVSVDHKAVVVLNERTGTVVMGADVMISPVSIAHGDLSIKVGAMAKGAAPKAGAVASLETSTVGKLVDSMNALGVKPADLVGILQAIQAAGALQADLKFM